MSISSNLAVTSDVDNYTLVELLELLGSPEKVLIALAELEKAARENTKALVDLRAAETERQANVDADNAEREKEIIAIAKDRDALVVAWEQLEKDTANRNETVNKIRQTLRKDQDEFKGQKKNLEESLKNIAKERDVIAAERDVMKKTVEDAKVDAERLRDEAAADRAVAEKTLEEANSKMAEMRKLVS